MQCIEQALPLLPLWRSAHEAIAKVADGPVLDEAFTERRRQVAADREIAITRQKELETRINELDSRLQSLGSDPVVMSHELEIETVFQRISAREKADQDRVELDRTRRSLDREISDLFKHLSVEPEPGEQVDASQAIERSIAKLHVNEALRARIRELAAAQAGLINRRNDASDLVETTKRRLADATQELDALGVVGDPAVLASVIESTGNPESEMDALIASRQNCDALRRRCESMLQRLEGFEGDLEQAVRLNLPSDSSVRQLAESLRGSLQEVRQRESLLEGLQQDRDAIHQQLTQAQADRRLPTLAELQSARQQRDSVVARFDDAVRLGQVSISDLKTLREQIRLADELADSMREHSEQVHRREDLSSQLEVLDSKIRLAKESAATAHTSFESAKSEWISAWRSCQISAGQPEQMQQWLANHGKLCDLMEQLESEEKRLEQIQARIHRAAARLRSALESVHSERTVRVTSALQAGLFDDPTEDDLISLYDEAVAIRSQWTRERQQHDAMTRKRDEWSEALPQAETRFEAAQRAVEDWHKDWRRLTESFVKSERAGTAEVLQMLDQISQLDGLKRERESVAAKLQAIEEDAQTYASQVEQLARAVDHRSDVRHAAQGIWVIQLLPPSLLCRISP